MTLYKTVEVEFDISEFDDEELISELRLRDYRVLDPEDDGDLVGLVSSIYENRRCGKDIEESLNNLIYHVLGRI